MKKLLMVLALLVPAIARAQAPSGTVTGQLLNRDGKPAASVRVSAMAVPEPGTPLDGATALESLAMTDSDGRYRLENLLPGRYYILAGFVDLPTYYPGVPAAGNATVVNVLSGTPVNGINFSVANAVGVTVSGRVLRASGTGKSSVAGQRLGMLGGTSGVQETTSTADGSFQFQRVRPGNYQVLSAGVRTSPPLSITVGDQDITGLEIIVIPTFDVTGNVVIEGSGPRPRIQLQLAPFKGNGQSQGIASQPDGSLRATLPEGEYRVSWSNLPQGFEIKSLTAGDVDLLTTPLKVAADAPPAPLRLLIAVDGNPFVKVSGRVTNAGSQRTLTLSGLNADQLAIAINPDGTFEIPQVLPGSYTVRPNLTAPTLATQPIQVVIPSQNTSGLIIALPETKELSGIVVNSAGTPVPGRFTLSYSQRSGTSSASGTRGMTTQPDGTFSLEVPVGANIQLSVNAGSPVKAMTYGSIDLTKQTMTVAATDMEEIRIVLDTTSTTMSPGTISGGGIAGGTVSGGIFSATLTAAPPAPPPPPPPPPPLPQPTALQSAAPAANVNRIAESIAKPNLISSAPPSYPALALAARVQGTVVLQVDISVDGRVQNITVVSGHPLLNEAAIQAVRQWTYKPFVLNGQAIPVVTTATVPFSLP